MPDNETSPSSRSRRAARSGALNSPRPVNPRGHRNGLRTGLRAFARAVSWHRRKLAVVCAVAAVLTGLTALAPPRPATVPVVRAKTSLAGGTVLRAEHVRLDHLPQDALPAGALADAALAVGKTLAGRVPAGQILASADLISSRFPMPSGQVIAPVRLADADVAALLSDGDLVDVMGADDQTARTTVVASRVRVVAVPPADRDAVSAGGGLILVEVGQEVATALARASVATELSVVWR